MNSPLGTKNRPWRARISAINGESSASITPGQPVAWNISDMGQVVLPATATAALAHPLFAGVAASTATPGQPLEIISGGLVTVIFRNRTRAASTDAFASVASSLQSAGCLLSIDSAANAFAYSTVGAAGLYSPQAVLAEALGSIASVASTTSNTSLFSTTTAKVWIRALT